MALGQTYQSGDIINNAKMVNVTIAGTIAAAPAVTINTAQSVNFRALVNQTVEAALFTGVANVNTTSTIAGTALTVTNGALASTYGIGGSTNAGGLTVGIRTADLTGAANTISLAANGAGLTAAAPGGNTNNVAALAISNATGIEGIALNFAGAGNNLVITGGATLATDLASFVATGAGTGQINVNALTNVATFDLSATTGNNALAFTNGLQTGTSILGGTGTTTLRVLQSGVTSSNITATSVETLRLSASTTEPATINGTISFKAAPSSLATIRVDGDTAENNVVVTLNKVGSPGTINFTGSGLTADTASAQQFRSISVTNSYTGDADTVAVNVGNQGQTLSSGIGYEVRSLTTLNGVEALNINAADIGARGVTSFAGLTGNAFSAIAATSAGSVTLGTVTAKGLTGDALGGTLTTVDLSKVAGTTRSTLTLGADTVSSSTTVIAAINGTEIAGIGTEVSTDSLEFVGSTADDRVNGAGFAGVIIAEGNDGNDELIGGTNADTLAGDAGNDTLTGNAGADTLTGGAGNDTFRFFRGDIAAGETINGGTGVNTIQVMDDAAATNQVNFSDLSTATIATAGLVQAIFIENATANGAIFTGAQLSGQVINVNTSVAAAAATLTVEVATGTTATLAALTFGANYTAGTDLVVINGNTGNETITGTSFGAEINGLAGIDTITGGAGNDVIAGGTGGDTLSGAAGEDTYVIAADSGSAAGTVAGVFSGFDSITFVTADDGFKGLADGAPLNTAAGKQATTAAKAYVGSSSQLVDATTATLATANFTNVDAVVSYINAVFNPTAGATMKFVVAVNDAATGRSAVYYVQDLATTGVVAAEVVLLGITTGVVATADFVI